MFKLFRSQNGQCIELNEICGQIVDTSTKVSPDGHFKGSEGISDKLIYIVQSEDGVQHTLTPAEFAEKYDWKNDPEKVRLAD